MNRNELIAVFKGAIRPDYTKFSAAEANELAIKGILESFGLQDASAREIRARQDEVFALIEEAIEELLPKAIDDIVGGFVETQTFARDAEPIFKTSNVGKARARMSITEGARGGIYRARRLDNKNFQVDVKVETVGAYVTLEEILLGKVSLAELMSNIATGFVERVYTKSVQALRTAKTLAPKANIEKVSTAQFNEAAMDKLIRIASAYGTPVIMGFRSAISKINNGAGWTQTPNISGKDAEDIRSRGFVNSYKGVPVVELPNYLVDENNAEFVFDEGDIFILPTDAKPIKVAMKGDLHIEEVKHPSGSVEQSAHRMLGVGLYLTNNICVYTDEQAASGKY
jgi:voltage-gated potassium channel Kch